MEKLNMNILSKKRLDILRQTDNNYYQSITYQHLWKEPNDEGKIDNIFIIVISDQFFKPETGAEFINSIEFQFQFFSVEPILHNYLKPEKRHHDAVGLITYMTHEAMKKMRNDTLSNLPKGDFENIKIAESTPEQVFRIVNLKLPQINKSKMPITLGKEDWVMKYVLAMFSILEKATSSTQVLVQGSVLIVQQRETNEKFNFDQTGIVELKNRILDFFSKGNNAQLLDLTQEESDIFRRCTHAAYYFEVELNLLKNNSLRDEFLALHHMYFRT